MSIIRWTQAIALVAILLGSNLAQAQTVFAYSSTPGDLIARGRTNTFTPANAAFLVYGDGSHLTIRVTGSEYWTIDLRAPPGQKLAVGNYYKAERSSFRTGRSPGLQVSGLGRTCNLIWGEFGIRQIRYDTAGNVVLLEADFVQRCEADYRPPLAGVLRYKAPYLYLKIDSDGQDFVGWGLKRTYFGNTSTFILSGTTSGFEYGASGMRDDWWAIINPPTGQKLQVRRYQATRFGDATHAGLSVSANGRGCNESTGTLDIKKLVTDSTGNISSVHAEVEQYCDGDTGPLRATIYYNTP